MKVNWKKWLKSKSYWKVTDSTGAAVIVYRNGDKAFDGTIETKNNLLCHIYFYISYGEFKELKSLIQSINAMHSEEEYTISFG